MERQKTSLRRQAYDFITQHPLAALATVDGSHEPDLAMVYCLIRADLTLYFSTRVEGRKYINLSRRPLYAMAFYDEETLTTVQLRGTASRIEDIALEQDILSDLTKLRFGRRHGLVPTIQLFESGASSELAVVQIIPTEMTLAIFDNERGTKYAAFFQKVI